MASSLFYTLKNHYPNAHFILVGPKITCELFKKDEQIEAVFIDDTKKSFFRLSATYKLAQKIGRLRYGHRFKQPFLFRFFALCDKNAYSHRFCPIFSFFFSLAMQ
ncbi:hypothetical protein [Helicobacter acinonychis]|uniref:hypothetical protein n=1 Tax=Helicobacter acinonychis TaxID=212 RepID=UPI002113CFF6|nr:hypothetical protein [Helicobacter acinonychis]